MVRRITPALVIAGVVALAVAAPAAPPGPASRPEAGSLWLSDSPLDAGRRMLIVVDSATKRAAVYHVDTATGTLTLKSARDLTWDLAIEDFNAQEPRPAALRAMLQPAGGPPTPPTTPR